MYYTWISFFSNFKIVWDNIQQEKLMEPIKTMSDYLFLWDVQMSPAFSKMADRSQTQKATAASMPFC